MPQPPIYDDWHSHTVDEIRETLKFNSIESTMRFVGNVVDEFNVKKTATELLVPGLWTEPTCMHVCTQT